MLCPDCGNDLTTQTVVEPGYKRCGVCGKLWGASISDTDTFSVDQPEVEIDRFLVGEKIGEGSFGVVHKSYDRELRRFVAIKIPKRLESRRSDLFLREARAASRLQHQNIVAIYDVFNKNGQFFIVSELIDGTSLREWVDANSPSIEQSCAICIKLCQAVHYAHDCGVIHRDIKPTNVMMDRIGEPHLLDFGLSHSRNLELESIGVQGQPIGTPAFMSPEQVRGQVDQIDRATDVYALGIVLFQLLTRQLPFRGRSSELYQKILEDNPPRPCSLNQKIPVSLEAICLKALKKDPSQRYPSASAMADDLQNFVDGKLVEAYGKFDRWTLKHLVRRRFAVGVTSVFAAGMLGAGWKLYSQHQANNPTQQVRIEFSPAESQCWMEPCDPETGLPEAQKRIDISSGNTIRVSPGFYRINFLNGSQQYYVYRTVPKNGDVPIWNLNGIKLPHVSWEVKKSIIELPPVTIKPVADLDSNMSFHAGGVLISDQIMGGWKNQEIPISPFLMDREEVSLTDFKSVYPEFTGPLRTADDRVVGIQFDLALAYAEKVGKQIPTAWQLLWAITNGGKTRFPWGDDVEEQPWPEQSRSQSLVDANRSQPPVYGLFSGPLEWADTPPPKLAQSIPHFNLNEMATRAVLGGPLEFERGPQRLSAKIHPARFGFRDSIAYHAQIGFRCVRNLA